MSETILQTGFPTPRPQTYEGTLVQLEPLKADAHAADLFEAGHVPDRAEKYRYLPDATPEDASMVRDWAERVEVSTDPMFFAVVDRTTGKAVGRQALMRIDATHGVAEIGHIYWGPGMARSAKATEALFLLLRHVFQDLGYRRFEWKCDAANQPSRDAAKRFGFAFEGVFRQHLIIKGKNRDTAWFSIIDGEWPALCAAYQAWLSPENFDATGTQKSALSDLTAEALRDLR